MPLTNPTIPDTGSPAPTGQGQSWVQAAWAWTGGTGGAITLAVLAALTGALATYLLTRRPGKADLSKHLMYLPLLLVNAAAIYGQVAFFYEKVAPATWAVPGKVALALLIAAAIESVAVYVGWHAHDALLQKATATAARLRRASYLIAAFVGLINYWHFTTGYSLIAPTAASFAFGLLSLISPWLWGLHTRRAQHKQLTRDGAIDQTGATFSSERIRLFPYRSFMARRWSVDNYVTDPQAAWEGYNASVAERRTVRPATRVRTAWLALTGQLPATTSGRPVRVEADIASPQEPDMPALPGPDTAPVTVPDVTAGHEPFAAVDITTGRLEALTSGHSPDMRPAASKPAKAVADRTLRRPARRTPNPPPKWTKDQLKAFRLRDTRPDITYPLIAREVGVSEKTVSRWFRARQDAETADTEASQRVVAPPLVLPVPEPKVSVTAGVNGHPLSTEEN